MKKDSINTKIIDFFSVRVDKEVAILSFRENLLPRLIDLGVRDRLLNDIDRLSKDPLYKIVPKPWLEEASLKVAHLFSQIPHRTLSGIKKLVNYSIHDMKDYLETENREIWKAGKDYLRTLQNQLEDMFDPIEF